MQNFIRCLLITLAVGIFANTPTSVNAQAFAVSTATSPLTGLWWNETESGWGVGITQRAGTVFVTWYSYEANGTPSWYVMSSCPVVADGCTGDIYRVTGGTPITSTWAKPTLAVPVIGRGALKFTSNDTGTFSYTINGTTITKPIARQIFGAQNAKGSTDYSDLWWNSEESGWGATITHRGTKMFVVMYTYDQSRNPIWYVASDCTAAATPTVPATTGCNGDLYRVSGGLPPNMPWGSPAIKADAVGTVSVAFSNANAATLSYKIDGVSGTKNLTRQFGDTAQTQAAATSFSRIQTEIFDPKCNSCHAAGKPFAVQSGLVLDAAVSYKNIINAAVKDPVAVSHAYKQIVPNKPELSFLYQKLLLWDPAQLQHFGSPMPLGTTSLSVGQLDFIKRWILAGAPETGDAIDAQLLADPTPPAYLPFTPLAAPTKGFQITSGQFTVPPKFERELFIYRKLGNAGEIYVNKVESKMRSNSHHLVLYSFPSNTPAIAIPQEGVIRDLRNLDNTINIGTTVAMGYHTFLAGAMTPNYTYTFPAGVALKMPANMGVDLNSHYVNANTTGNIVGEAYANFHTVDASEVQYAASTLNLANTSLSLPPGVRTTQSKSFTFNAETRIVMLTSHTHKLGEKFIIRLKGGTRDGQIVYTSTDWEHPVPAIFTPPLVLKAGEGLTSEITYNNTTNRTITFGLTSEDEMGIIFGYYY
jgi:Copper type II ascorbate-dependent monooxygenase, C-terminal domain